MNRHEFLALIIASPLAVLFGRRGEQKPDITQGQYLYRNDFSTVEPLTKARMKELYECMCYPSVQVRDNQYKYIKQQLAFLRGEQWEEAK